MLNKLVVGIAASVAWFALAVTALAVECRSVGGHVNGQQVSVVRRAVLDDKRLVLSGSFNGSEAPTRVLECVPLNAGIMCTRDFGPIVVTVMSNGARLIETATDRNTGKEVSGVAYSCDDSLRIGG